MSTEPVTGWRVRCCICGLEWQWWGGTPGGQADSLDRHIRSQHWQIQWSPNVVQGGYTRIVTGGHPEPPLATMDSALNERWDRQ